MSERDDFDRDIPVGDDFDLDEGASGDKKNNGDQEEVQPASAEGEEDGAQDRDLAGKKQKKHRFGWIIPVALVCIFAFSFYKFLSQYLTYQQAINEYKEVGSMISTVPESEEEESSEDAASVETAAEESTEEEDDDGIPDVEEPSYPKLAIDFDGLTATNSEFVGVIRIPALDLTYPVAQAEDSNEKYLTTTFEGTHNASGCIFLDCNATKDFSDWNTYIFGHNMKNQTMFGSLKRFISDDTLCDSDPYIYLYVHNHAGDTVKEQILGKTYERTLEQDETRILKYRIFAYYTIPVDDDVYDDFEGKDGYDDYVTDAEKHSLYTPEDGAVDWSLRPDLLTLSTCYATGHVNNFIVQGALVGIAHER